MTKHIPPFFLIMLSSCMSGNGKHMDDLWGGSVAAPGAFVALDGTERLNLPATPGQLEAYLTRSGAVFHSVGSSADIYKSVPAPKRNSPCQKTENAIVFSYGLQGGAFVPRYIAYIANSYVVCIDRQFAYSGT